MKRLAGVCIALVLLGGCGAKHDEAIRWIDATVPQKAAVATVTLPDVVTTTTSAVPVRRYVAPASRSKPSQPIVVASGDLIDALARCESGMRQVTGPPFHSFFQWVMTTWYSVSGMKVPPEQVDYATQKDIVRRKMPVDTWAKRPGRTGQFPGCAAKLGIT